MYDANSRLHLVRADPYIRGGYRRQLNSFRACFWSLFYLHNELINVWSHLLPAFIYLLALLSLDFWTFHSGFEAPARDVAFFHMYIVCTVGCLLLSAIYHVTNAHSEEISRYFLKLDYCTYFQHLLPLLWAQFRGLRYILEPPTLYFISEG